MPQLLIPFMFFQSTGLSLSPSASVYEKTHPPLLCGPVVVFSIGRIFLNHKEENSHVLRLMWSDFCVTGEKVMLAPPPPPVSLIDQGCVLSGKCQTGEREPGERLKTAAEGIFHSLSLWMRAVFWFQTCWKLLLWPASMTVLPAFATV